MAFDITTAVEVQGTTNPVIPTTKFDISTATELNPEPAKKVYPIATALRKVFKNLPTEQVRKYWTIAQEAKAGKLPKPSKGEEFGSWIKRISDEYEEKQIEQGVVRQVQDPMTAAVVGAAVTAPVATAAAVGGFSVLDHFFNARRLVEEKAPNTPPLIKEVVEILDFAVKGAVVGGGFAVKNFIVDRMNNLNLPKSVAITPEQAEVIKRSPTITEPLEIKPEQIDASINSGTSIQVPIEKVIDLAMSDKWPSIQEKLGLSTSQKGSEELKLQSKEIVPPQASESQIKPTPEDLSKSVPLNEGIQRERGFVKSVEESPMVGKETKSEMKELPKDVRTYDVYSDKEALAKAQERVSKDSEEALSYVLSTDSLDKDVATTGLELMRKYRTEGKTEQEVNLAANLAERGTKSGQFIQAFSILDKLSPEGILVFAQREINKGITDATKKKVIDPALAEALKKQAQIIQDTPYGYQKVVETNKLIEMIAEKRGRTKADWINELANLPRSLSASLGDFSFPGRQGIFLAPSYPKEWASAFGKQFGAFAKQENYNSLMDSIMKHPDFKLAEESGISFTDIRTKLSKMEEKYLGANLAEKIPIVGRGVIATQRAYTAAANKMRIDIFSRIINDYKNLGIKPDKKLLEQTAEFVNSGTGRGSLGSFEKSASFLNGFFFSPRLMTSRLKLLNPITYVGMEAPLRKQALKSLFTFIGTGATILTVAKLMGADVGTDPRSADFGKIKVGNTRIDIWGGFQQYVRMMAQQVSGEYVSSTTGKKLTLGEGYKPLTRYDILLRQIESKEAPVFSLITDILKQQNFKGEKINVPAEVLQRFTPMVAQDMYDLYKEDPALVPLGILSIFGQGVQTYAPKKSNKF